MTDSRPEITAKADGAQVVLRLEFHPGIYGMPLSVDEAFVLQCQLATAIEQVKASDGTVYARLTEKGIAYLRELDSAKPETWRDREPML